MGVNFRNREFLTDVVVFCGTRSFRAHSYVLCTGSSYFERRFANREAPFIDADVDLPATISAEAFEIVLEFLYTGYLPPQIENNSCRLTDLLGASHELKISELYQICLARLENMLSSNHFLDLWNLSVRYGETALQQKITAYVVTHFPATSTCVDFFKLTDAQLFQVLQHPRFDKSNVDQIFRGILEWVKYDSEARQRQLHSLISAFDVNRVSNEYVKVLLNSEPLIKQNASVYDMVVAVSSTRLLTARTAVMSAASTIGPKLFCFGRLHNGSALTVFCRRTLAWSTAQLLPYELSEGTAVAAHDGKLYFVGGGVNATRATDTILEYSYTEWQLLSHSALQSEVWKAGVCVLGSEMYIVGGMNRQNVVTNIVQCYSFDDRSCIHLPCTNNSYCVPVVVATNQYVFVVGSSFRTLVEKFDPRARQWTVIYPHCLMGLSPRAAVCAQKLYVLNDTIDGKFLVFSPDDNSCQEENFVGGPEEIRGMWSVSDTSGFGNFILARDDRKALFSYDPETQRWSLLANPVSTPWNWWQTVMVP